MTKLSLIALSIVHMVIANSTVVHNQTTYIIHARGSISPDTAIVKDSSHKPTYNNCAEIPVQEGEEGPGKRDCKSRDVTDTNENRIPMTVTTVACDCVRCVTHGCPGTCQQVNYTMPMLFFKEYIDEEAGLSRYELKDVEVPVACKCVATSGKTWKSCKCRGDSCR